MLHKSEQATGGLGNHPSHRQSNSTCPALEPAATLVHSVVHQEDDTTHPLGKTVVSGAMKTALSEVGSTVYGQKPRYRAKIRDYIQCCYIVCSHIICREARAAGERGGAA